MIHKQRFFERRNGSAPQIYGYGRVSHPNQFDKGDSIEGQEARINAYMASMNFENGPFKGAVYAGMFPEPLAQSALKKPFMMRPMGRQLFEKLEPGDHLIVDKFDRFTRSVDDFCLMHRWFIEHGVCLHILNLMGLQFNSQSAAGEMMAIMMANFAQFENALRGERVRDARARLRAQKRSAGVPAPKFCEEIDLPPGKKRGGKLVMQPWALPLMEQMDRLVLGGMTPAKAAATAYKEPIAQEHDLHWDYLERMFWFYRGWCEMGRPDINEVKIHEVADNYKRKYRQEKKNGS